MTETDMVDPESIEKGSPDRKTVNSFPLAMGSIVQRMNQMTPSLFHEAVDISELKSSIAVLESEIKFYKQQISMMQKHETYLKEEISEKMDEFKTLQHKTNELQSKIVKFQTETPKIYYVGAIFGIASTVFGGLISNILYIAVGIGIAITALVGIWEVKHNARKGVI